ncbi:MAG: RluA family pseudouridine synthase [Gammaproteobacteria bacterium]|nr:RluA family pseudouridine synthase [Gammaproteobacteria bacterium]
MNRKSPSKSAASRPSPKPGARPASRPASNAAPRPGAKSSARPTSKASSGGAARSSSERPARKSSANSTYQPRQKGDWNNVLNPAPSPARAGKPANRPSSKPSPDRAVRSERPAARFDKKARPQGEEWNSGPAPTRAPPRTARAAAARSAERPAERPTERPLERPKPRPAASGAAAKPRASKPAFGKSFGSRPSAAKKKVTAPKFNQVSRAAVKAKVAEPANLPSVVVHMTVGPNEDGQRIDNYLMKCLPGVPKSHIYLILRSGQVRVDGGRVKPDRKIALGEEIRIPPVRIAEKTEQIRAPDAVLNRLRDAIVYEDEHYLAICKPAGLASHGGTGIAYGVIEAARGWGKYDFLELAHRLDRDTSGVLLLAKSRPGLLRAQRAFREGLADKRYFALIVGRLQGGARDVDAALVKRSIPGGERFIDIDEEDGKPSKSRFVPQAHYKDATLCEVHIFSGRTHQIRVHALALGHPVAGDRKYGLRDDQKPIRDKGLRRMFLHSHFLQLPADGDFGKLILNAPMTEELREFLDVLGPGR